MKNYFLLITAVLLSFSSNAQTNFLDKPYMEINSLADSLVVPDEIFLSITLNEADSKNKISTEELEAKLLKILNSLKIDNQKDLSLKNYGSKNNNYFLKGKQVIKSKTYELKLNSAEIANELLFQAEAEGISNIRITKMQHSKSKEIQQILKVKAIEKGKANAKIMAQTAEQKLGKILYIADSYTYVNVMTDDIIVSGYRSTSRATNSEMSGVEFQKMKFQSNINLKFELLPN